MNLNGLNQVRLNVPGIGCWLTLIAGAMLLGAVGLGWLVKSILVLLLLLTLAPIGLFLGFRWWLKRNLVQGQCPVCGADVAGFKGTESICLSCNTPLRADLDGFHRVAPAGTIDVAAVEVPTVEVLPDAPFPNVDPPKIADPSAQDANPS